MTNNRESIVNTFGLTFKAVEWNPHYHGNGVDNPWLDEEPIRRKYWNSFKKGDVVIDVGACFGLYAMSALAQGATVVAFEPNKEFYGLLKESVSMNDGFLERYTCYDIGIWNGTVLPLELEKCVLEWCKQKPPFKTTTLDMILKDIDHIDMIKIDVEGAEFGVLEGAKEIIEKFRPKLLIEDHTGLYKYCEENNTRQNILTMLQNYGYFINIELFGGPPPPNGGRYFIIAEYKNKDDK